MTVNVAFHWPSPWQVPSTAHSEPEPTAFGPPPSKDWAAATRAVPW
ncbi:hypothetical protein ABDJ25_34955 [Streptomyces actinocidus]